MHVSIVRLIRRIALTCDTEIDCGECGQLSPLYVEAVLSGQDSVARWELVRVHLEQCPVCAEEYQYLSRLVSMELTGNWPTIADLMDGWGARV